MKAEKNESFRSESKKKAIFKGFNFDMGNVSQYLFRRLEIGLEYYFF